MRLPGAAFRRQRRAAAAFRALPREQRAIVFYAEDAVSHLHFRAIIDELIGRHGRDVCYLTSQDDDPILASARAGLHAFGIGGGTVWTSVSMQLDAGVLVMTLPELELHHVKRSRTHDVHYAYVFHSMVSTHRIYREGAFDHYDTVLCVGPHHVREIRAREAALGLPPKDLVESGYGRLDDLLVRAADVPPPRRDDAGRLRVLIAPSWGPHGLLETRGEEACQVLLDAGFQVTVRPHPETRRHRPEAVRKLAERFGGEPAFALEPDIAGSASLEAAHLMVSDWSGAALEFAFAFERPVLFVDVPAKVLDPNHAQLGLAPLEQTIREEIGAVVAPESLALAPERIESLCADPGAFAGRIRAAREAHVFHPGGSGAVAAAAIAARADAWLARAGDP